MDLVKILEKLGLSKGDTVFVTANLLEPSILLKGSLSAELLSAIMDIIGEDGTVMVQTYTTYTSRYGNPFIYEEKKCINGAFSKFILEQPDSLRTLHPVNSYTALGKNRDFLCSNNSWTNYGLGSPLHRLILMNGKVLRINIPVHLSPLMYYVENTWGVPYSYIKIFNCEVYKEGEKINQTFCGMVRYLHLEIEHDLDKMKKIFTKRFIQHQLQYDLWNSSVSLIGSQEIVKCFEEMIRNDPWGLLKKKPLMKLGEVPYDGITKGRDGVS